MKKREKTINLVSESETLENQNISLKTEARELECQRQKLVQLLEAHSPKCVYRNGYHPIPLKSPAFKFLTDLGFISTTSPISSHNTSTTTTTTTSHTTHSKYNNNNHINGNNNNNNISNSNNNNRETIKYSRKHSPPNTINFCTKTTLPPGYCKPSPTNDINYISTDSGFIDIASVAAAAQQHHQQNLDHFTHHNLNFKTDYIPNCENSSDISSSIITNGSLDGNHHDNQCIQLPSDGSEFITLKSELQDSTSPYTTVQSADRFLFENSETFIDIDRLHNSPLPSMKESRYINVEYNGNIQSFDTSLIKSDFISQDIFNDTQFTDLDSGITSYTIPSNSSGCPA